MHSAIERELMGGNTVAFIGVSNGGHIALQLAFDFDAAWVILASSAPLMQQMRRCRSWRKPLVVTICQFERYFGGADCLWDLAKDIHAHACWCKDARHCGEAWDEQECAARVVRDWLASAGA